jgi:hypothetical protein
LRIYDVPIPGNAEIYIAEFTKLIELNDLNPDGILKVIGYGDISVMDFILGKNMDNFAKKDGSKSIYEELKFFIMIGLVALAFVVILCFLAMFTRFKQKIISYVKKEKKKFMFNGIIRAISISYI